ncbi:MAG: PTS system mannose-specific EIIBCA component [Chlamydiae bacterium]|nr:PTS system mannose-specific EIIBCA component [Chlamydiota bacterium]
MESVAFLEATSRDEAIKELIQRLSQDHNLVNEEEFLNAIMQREKIASTGIGVGVAVPHAKLPIYDDFFIAVGILKQGIDWGAMDELPVKLIFLIGGPDDKQTQYLNLLSQLTLYLRDEEVRKKLLTLTAPEQMIQIFQT